MRYHLSSFMVGLAPSWRHSKSLACSQILVRAMCTIAFLQRVLCSAWKQSLIKAHHLTVLSHSLRMISAQEQKAIQEMAFVLEGLIRSTWQQQFEFLQMTIIIARGQSWTAVSQYQLHLRLWQSGKCRQDRRTSIPCCGAFTAGIWLLLSPTTPWLWSCWNCQDLQSAHAFLGLHQLCCTGYCPLFLNNLKKFFKHCCPWQSCLYEQ